MNSGEPEVEFLYREICSKHQYAPTPTKFKPSNKVFAFGQAIREASLTVLRPTVHGSERAGRKNKTEV